MTKATATLTNDECDILYAFSGLKTPNTAFSVERQLDHLSSRQVEGLINGGWLDGESLRLTTDGVLFLRFLRKP